MTVDRRGQIWELEGGLIFIVLRSEPHQVDGAIIGGMHVHVGYTINEGADTWTTSWRKNSINRWHELSTAWEELHNRRRLA